MSFPYIGCLMLVCTCQCMNNELSSLSVVWNLLLCDTGCCDLCVKLRQELEKVRRRLEVELADTREQLAERTSQLHDVQAQLNRREQELQTALNR